MHFTLWTSNKAPSGAYTEITWETFLGFVSSPVVAAEKNALAGWSPARFRDNRRAKANVELVSAIVLDDDKSGLPIERLCEVYTGVAGVAHTTFSSTEAAPKYRIVLRCSRDLDPDEHARVWAWCAAQAAQRGEQLDTATRDPSRLWYAPSRHANAPYDWRELPGEPLPVDEILASSPADTAPVATAAAPRAEAPAASRRTAMALGLGASWPEKGDGRNEAQLALAGALRNEGFSEAEAVEFLCNVCRVAGDEDRPKRETTARLTYGKPEGSRLIGWTRLKSFVDPVVVDAARTALGRGAESDERTMRRLAEAAQAREEALAPAHHIRTAGGLVFRSGGWDEPLPPPRYVVDPLLVAGSVSLFVAHGSSLKSMTANSIGIAVARGDRWLGKFATQKGRVVVLDFERGGYEARRRAKLLGAGDVQDFLYCAQPAARTDDPKFWEDLAELRPTLVIVDSLAAGALGVDENDARAAAPLTLAQKFAQMTGAAVIFIHHARKGAGGDKRESVRGSTAIFAAVDKVDTFEALDAPDGIKRMRITCIKMNLGREPVPFAVELSDTRGLVFFEEPAATAGRNAETVDDMRAAIRLALADGPVRGVKALALKASKRDGPLGKVLKLMTESGEVVCIEGAYQLDDDAQRTQRVLSFVGQHPSDGRFNSTSALAKIARVSPHVVERLVLQRKIFHNDSGGWLSGP